MLPADAPALAALFAASIETLTSDDYDAGQRAAWAGSAEDEDAFGRKLAQWLTLVATVEGRVAGFAALKMPDQIEMLYVDPDHAGQGVANALCDALERLATARGAGKVSVQASDTAQGFFTKRGYRAERRGTIALGDEWLGCTSMMKTVRDDATALPDA